MATLSTHRPKVQGTARHEHFAAGVALADFTGRGAGNEERHGALSVNNILWINEILDPI